MNLFDIKMCNFTIREVELHIFFVPLHRLSGQCLEIIENVPHSL